MSLNFGKDTTESDAEGHNKLEFFYVQNRQAFYKWPNEAQQCWVCTSALKCMISIVKSIDVGNL